MNEHDMETAAHEQELLDEAHQALDASEAVASALRSKLFSALGHLQQVMGTTYALAAVDACKDAVEVMGELEDKPDGIVKDDPIYKTTWERRNASYPYGNQ